MVKRSTNFDYSNNIEDELRQLNRTIRYQEMKIYLNKHVALFEIGKAKSGISQLNGCGINKLPDT